MVGRRAWERIRFFTLLAGPALLLVAGVWCVDQTAFSPPDHDLLTTSRLLSHTEAENPPGGAERRPLPRNGLLRRFSHGFLWVETGPIPASDEDRVLVVSETRPMAIEAWLVNPGQRGHVHPVRQVVHREPALSLPAGLPSGARLLIRIETAYPVELALELDTRTRFERRRAREAVAGFVLALALAGLCLTAVTQLALQRSLLAALFLGEVMSLCFAVFAVSGYGEYLWAREGPIAQYGSSVAFLVAVGSGLAFGSRFLFLELARPGLARVVDGLAVAALALAMSPVAGAPVWFMDAAVSAGSFAALPLLTALPLLRARDGIREGDVLLGAWSFLFAAGSLLGLGRWGLIDLQVPDHFILGVGVCAELFTLSTFMLTRQMQLQTRARLEASRAEKRLVLAHEINNRLGSVQLQARLARRETVASSPALRERLATIEHCMADVALTLDEWRSTTAGACEDDPFVHVADLREWLRRTIAQLRPELVHRVDLAGPALPAPIRNRALTEIIGNLLSNADIHGAPTGPIRIELRSIGEDLLLECANRLPADKEARHGWGIGLPLARAAAESLDGRIETREAGEWFVARLRLRGQPRQPHRETDGKARARDPGLQRPAAETMLGTRGRPDAAAPAAPSVGPVTGSQHENL